MEHSFFHDLGLVDPWGSTPETMYKEENDEHAGTEAAAKNSLKKAPVKSRPRSWEPTSHDDYRLQFGDSIDSSMLEGKRSTKTRRYKKKSKRVRRRKSTRRKRSRR